VLELKEVGPGSITVTGGSAPAYVEVAHVQYPINNLESMAWPLVGNPALLMTLIEDS
jgi:hypothetical protein